MRILYALLIFLALVAEAKSVKNIAYSIQVGSFKNLENAGNLADTLNKRGLDAFFFKEDSMYKVRFGDYKDSNTARSIADKYKKQGIIDSYIIIAPQSYAINQKNNNSIRESLSKDAHKYIGVPYKWGGSNSSGFDCSGLVSSVYRLNGMSIPRTSYQQFEAGKFVSKANLKTGDLVFFITDNGKKINHVGIYIGNGKFIHAPGKGKRVSIADLNANYWTKVYKGARTYVKE